MVGADNVPPRMTAARRSASRRVMSVEMRPPPLGERWNRFGATNVRTVLASVKRLRNV